MKQKTTQRSGSKLGGLPKLTDKFENEYKAWVLTPEMKILFFSTKGWDRTLGSFCEHRWKTGTEGKRFSSDTSFGKYAVVASFIVRLNDVTHRFLRLGGFANEPGTRKKRCALAKNLHNVSNRFSNFSHGD